MEEKWRGKRKRDESQKMGRVRRRRRGWGVVEGVKLIKGEKQ